MYNLLPEVKPEIAQKTAPIHTVWKPDAANARTGKISYVLESQLSKDDRKPPERYARNSLPQQEPNLRLLSHFQSGIDDPSPLSERERGVPEDAILSMQTVLDQRPKSQKYSLKKAAPVGMLTLCMMNELPTAMDLYVQKKMSLFNRTIEPEERFLSCVAGESKGKASIGSEQLLFYFSTLRRAAVTTTNRQIIRDFAFNIESPIGMEIEMQYGRLVCTKVLPDCQASLHSTQLDGAELIAVNGERVIDLDEFQAAMITAKSSGSIVLKMAAFKDGRGKLDTLYLHDFQNTTQVKSLLSNLFMRGINNDINSFDSQDWSSDDDDDEEAEEEENLERAESKIVEENIQSQYHEEGKNDAIIIDNDAVAQSTGRTIDTRDSSDSDSRSSRSSSDSGYRIRKPRGNARAAPKSTDADSKTSDEKQSIHATEKLAHSDADKLYPGDIVDEDDGGMMASKTKKVIEPVNPVVRTAMETKEEDEKTVDSESESSWNKLTKVDEVFSFKSLVCIPDRLLFSEEWGEPHRRLQISNFSKDWIVQVYWIDENGAMIEKGVLQSGSVMQQPCATSHVWAIVATAKSDSSKKTVHNTQHQSTNADMESSVAQDESVALGTTCGRSVQQSSSPALLTLRPTLPALVPNKCTSVMWTPWSSLSITQRVYSKNKNRAQEMKGSEMSSNSLDPFPEMHLQLFDGPQNISGGSLQSMNVFAPTTSINTIERTKLSKWPRRKLKR